MDVKLQTEVVELKPIDINVFFFKHCIQCGQNHTVLVALNSHSSGAIALGISGNKVDVALSNWNDQTLLPNPKVATRSLKKVCEELTKEGYVLAWRGRKLGWTEQV